MASDEGFLLPLKVTKDIAQGLEGAPSEANKRI